MIKIFVKQQITTLLNIHDRNTVRCELFEFLSQHKKGIYFQFENQILIIKCGSKQITDDSINGSTYKPILPSGFVIISSILPDCLEKLASSKTNHRGVHLHSQYVRWQPYLILQYVRWQPCLILQYVRWRPVRLR